MLRIQRRLTVVAAALLVSATCAGCTRWGLGKFALTDAKICQNVDADRQPVGITSEFPTGTSVVHCWFAWKEAPPQFQLVARWYYATEEFLILAFPVTLTRRADHGVVSLKMIEGKSLPPGNYRVEFLAKTRVLKTLPFTVR